MAQSRWRSLPVAPARWPTQRWPKQRDLRNSSFSTSSDLNAGTCPLGLDCQNGGFTVFGRVVGTGMTVVDNIVALPRYNLGGAFDTVPLRGDNSMSLANRLVFLNTVQVLNFKAGDYDFNGTVNAADYAVWRSSFGSTTNAAADGNGNGIASTLLTTLCGVIRSDNREVPVRGQAAFLAK